MGGTPPDLHISTADLKSSAPTFHDQSRALGQAAATLKKKLDELGSPWGDDDSGKQFHASYGPSRTSVEKAVGILVQGLESISEAFKDMADGHSGNDHQVAAMFKKAAGLEHGDGKGGK
ncbi:WXG100 family type VII secretion target [Streptomyces sp. RPT161]|uniref:WXG100 family type VII secretion target n=1 Tax=Streptomyces sp. RPT161 TaxID=3015993 RepID=UPI0022B92A6F|nr:hypothetical protein [Streptomyces sp. RPT161]